VKALRHVVDRERKHTSVFGLRIPKALRGLAFRSQFIRDFNYCPELLDFLGKIAGESIVPHGMLGNFSHTNFGEISNGAAIDQWHQDSVPYVLVVIISDLTDSVGGELQIINKETKEAFELIKSTNNNVPADFLLNVNYMKQGYGVFMQGSKMVHHVTPLLKAKEARISVVNSYMPRNCHRADWTIYNTFSNGQDLERAPMEYARHRAWISAAQLQAFVRDFNFSVDAKEVSTELKHIIGELQRTVDLIEGTACDKIFYYKEIDDAKMAEFKKQDEENQRKRQKKILV
jgi:hypothetical protein